MKAGRNFFAAAVHLSPDLQLAGCAPAARGSANAAHARRTPATETAARRLVNDGGVLRLGLHRTGALRLRLRGKGDGCQQQCAAHGDCEFAHPGLLRGLGWIIVGGE